MAFRNPDVPNNLSKTAPDFCTVHAISKGKVQNVKTASRSATPFSTVSPKPTIQSGYSSDSSFSQSSWKSGSDRTSFDISSEGSSQSTFTDYSVMNPFERNSSSRSPYPPSVSNLNYMVRTTAMGSPIHPNFSSASSEYSGLSSFQSTNYSFENLDRSQSPESSKTNSYASSQREEELEDEMRRLKQELKHTMEMYNSAYNESLNAKQKVREIDEWKSTEAHMIAQQRRSEEDALALVEMEKQKCRAAMEAAQKAQRLAELESHKRRCAEHLAI